MPAPLVRALTPAIALATLTGVVQLAPAAADVAGACTAPVTASIPEIQGSGAASPLAGQDVTTRGVVVADTLGSSGLNGLFVQDLTGDGDTATSDGIFVFLPSSNPVSAVDVKAGDEVLVSGRALEFQTLTEISPVTALEVCRTAAVPTPATVDLPETVEGDLERVEGMLVTVAPTLTVQQNFFLGRYGQLTLGGGWAALHTDGDPSRWERRCPGAGRCERACPARARRRKPAAEPDPDPVHRRGRHGASR